MNVAAEQPQRFKSDEIGLVDFLADRGPGHGERIHQANEIARRVDFGRDHVVKDIHEALKLVLGRRAAERINLA